MFDFETSTPEVLKPNSNILVRNNFFLENDVLQREPFFTMCYTINISPLIANK